ncbi:hypothetical protein HHL17_14445 [Chitinophaga sp. G-6-1-13]|uniref:Lipoprotein n=1 Tax=Chitinophaga fulva TaxID=2728842 RepID=A0A848GJ34_9BACT|nr:hypothetical protein [Chitinophaga fulva]NML38404.1 hypothetical protein [Chitinophaga fulva]
MRCILIVIGIASGFWVSCNQKTAHQELSRQNLDSLNEVIQKPAPVKEPVERKVAELHSDTLIQIGKEDTVDCGAIINTLFHRSKYEFPVKNGYKREELTAVIENAVDSILSIKIMFIDPTDNYRTTVDWLTLNCKNKKLQTIEKAEPNSGEIEIKYDVRFLDILMRKCALNY